MAKKVLLLNSFDHMYHPLQASFVYSTNSFPAAYNLHIFGLLVFNKYTVKHLRWNIEPQLEHPNNVIRMVLNFLIKEKNIYLWKNFRQLNEFLEYYNWGYMFQVNLFCGTLRSYYFKLHVINDLRFLWLFLFASKGQNWLN